MNLDQLRKDALAIFQAGLKAVDPLNAVKQHMSFQNDTLNVRDRTYNLASYESVYVIGAGKASAAMAQPIEELWGEGPGAFFDFWRRISPFALSSPRFDLGG